MTQYIITTLAQQVGLSHTSTYHTLRTTAYPYKISIQHELKPADSPKRAKFWWWLCHYAHGDVLVFNMFFFSDESWFHLNSYVNTQKYCDLSLENPLHSLNNVVAFPNNWCLLCHESQTCSGVIYLFIFLTLHYCRVILRYYLAIYCTFA